MKGLVTFKCGKILILSFILFVNQVHTENRNDTRIESSCNQSDCLRCDLEAAQCVKCLHVIEEETRQCLRSCPHGFDPIWSRSTSVFGRMCAERSVLSLVSQRQVGIIAGASILGAICVGIFLGILVLHKKGVKSPPGSPPRALPRSLQDKRPKTEETNVKGKEREELVSRLRQLRTDAPHIFRMMAETRSRFKGGSGPDNPSETRTKACKAVVRDLSRVLCLLSRKEEHLKTAPKDWDRLLAWTERLLVRYKRQQELKDFDAKGESGDSPSPTGNGRHLFVTRQQKAQEDRRRWIQRTPSNEQKKPLDFAVDVFDFSFKDESEAGTSSEDGSIPDSPPPKLALTPLNSTESLLPKQSPPSGKRKKNLLNLNKQLWSKLTPFKDSSSSGESKGSESDVEKASDQSSDLGSDIESQTFFDHIEAFAFDDPINVEEINESNNNRRCRNNNNNIDRINNNNKRRTELKKIDSIWKEPFRPKKISDTNNRFTKAKNANKEHRPSRIRRISSSLLRKDRKPTIAKDDNKRRRRPITRQKMVDKDKRSAIQEKLKKTSTTSAESDFEGEVVHKRSVFESPSSEVPKESQTAEVNEVIEGGDVYFQVTKTPVLVHKTKNFSHFDSEQQKREKNPFDAAFLAHMEEKTSHSRSKFTNPPIIRRRSLSQDRILNSKNLMPRCEILTNV